MQAVQQIETAIIRLFKGQFHQVSCQCVAGGVVAGAGRGRRRGAISAAGCSHPPASDLQYKCEHKHTPPCHSAFCASFHV